MPDNKQAEEAAIYNAAIRVLVEQNHELQRQIRVLKATSLHSAELERVIKERDEWISVEDSLPTEKGYYICWCGDEPGLIHYSNNGWQNGFYNNKVTHWRKIQKPTK